MKAMDDKIEPEVEKEIAYYNSLPIEFNGFINLPELSDGEIRLVCTAKTPANPAKNWLPSYDFVICKGSEKVGNINLRIGYGGGPFNSNCYYGGQIGYGVDEKYRGNGFAGRACKLLEPVAKAHGMTKLLVTTDAENTASIRVCEKLGLRLVRKVRIPAWHQLYKDGGRYENIFEWDIS
jgi:tagatose 1,6-diphosphate aldolase